MQFVSDRARLSSALQAQLAAATADTGTPPRSPPWPRWRAVVAHRLGPCLAHVRVLVALCTDYAAGAQLLVVATPGGAVHDRDPFCHHPARATAGQGAWYQTLPHQYNGYTTRPRDQVHPPATNGTTRARGGGGGGRDGRPPPSEHYHPHGVYYPAPAPVAPATTTPVAATHTPPGGAPVAAAASAAAVPQEDASSWAPDLTVPPLGIGTLERAGAVYRPGDGTAACPPLLAVVGGQQELYSRGVSVLVLDSAIPHPAMTEDERKAWAAERAAYGWPADRPRPLHVEHRVDRHTGTVVPPLPYHDAEPYPRWVHRPKLLLKSRCAPGVALVGGEWLYVFGGHGASDRYTAEVVHLRTLTTRALPSMPGLVGEEPSLTGRNDSSSSTRSQTPQDLASDSDDDAATVARKRALKQRWWLPITAPADRGARTEMCCVPVSVPYARPSRRAADDKVDDDDDGGRGGAGGGEGGDDDDPSDDELDAIRAVHSQFEAADAKKKNAADAADAADAAAKEQEHDDDDDDDDDDATPAPAAAAPAAELTGMAAMAAAAAAISAPSRAAAQQQQKQQRRRDTRASRPPIDPRRRTWIVLIGGSRALPSPPSSTLSSSSSSSSSSLAAAARAPADARQPLRSTLAFDVATERYVIVPAFLAQPRHQAAAVYVRAPTTTAADADADASNTLWVLGGTNPVVDRLGGRGVRTSRALATTETLAVPRRLPYTYAQARVHDDRVQHHRSQVAAAAAGAGKTTKADVDVAGLSWWALPPPPPPPPGGATTAPSTAVELAAAGAGAFHAAWCAPAGALPPAPQWVPGPTMWEERRGHAVAELCGEVFVCGGFASHGGVTDSVEWYDRSPQGGGGGRFVHVPSMRMPAPMQHFSAVVL